MCLVAFVFVMITIIVIIIAQGKQVTEKGIVDTSIVRLHTTPSDVTAYINDKQVKLIENRIENIEPGEVRLQLNRDGYSTWEKILTLEAGMVKDIYAQLYPLELKFTQITKSDIDEIFFCEQADFIYYTILSTENPKEAGIWRLKLTRSLISFGEDSPSKLVEFDSKILSIIQGTNYSIRPSYDNNRFILDIPEQKLIYIYNANKVNEYVDLVKQIGFYPEKVSWYRNSDAVIVQNDKILFEYEISTDQKSLIYYSPDSHIVSTNNIQTAYVFKTKEKEFDKYVNKNITMLKLPDSFIIPETVNKLYSPNSQTEVLIIEGSTGLTYIDLDKNFVDNFADEGEILSVSSEANALVYKVKDKLFTYVLETNVGNKPYHAQITEVNIKINELENIYYSPTGIHLIALLKTQEGNRTLWLMDSDGQNPRILVSEKSISGNKSQITNNGATLYLLLEDNPSQTTQLDNSSQNQNSHIIKNIYKLSLQQ